MTIVGMNLFLQGNVLLEENSLQLTFLLHLYKI